MILIKEYIKKILEIYKFEDAEFSKGMFEVMWDNLQQTQEPINYKNVIIELFEEKEDDEYIYEFQVSFHEDTPLKLYILPWDNKISSEEFKTNFEEFKNYSYKMVKEHINILKFNELFIKEMKKREYRSLDIKNTFFSKKSGDVFLSVRFFHDDMNEPQIGFWREGLIQSMIGYKKNKRFMVDADALMEMVKEHLDSIERIRI